MFKAQVSYSGGGSQGFCYVWMGGSKDIYYLYTNIPVGTELDNPVTIINSSPAKLKTTRIPSDYVLYQTSAYWDTDTYPWCTIRIQQKKRPSYNDNTLTGYFQVITSKYIINFNMSGTNFNHRDGQELTITFNMNGPNSTQGLWYPIDMNAYTYYPPGTAPPSNPYTSTMWYGTLAMRYRYYTPKLTYTPI